MNLSDHFTLDEATYSETAIRMGINNQPDEQQLENMKSAAEKLEEVRNVTGALRVNSSRVKWSLRFIFYSFAYP